MPSGVAVVTQAGEAGVAVGVELCCFENCL